MYESVLNIKLMDFPPVSNSNRNYNTFTIRFNNWCESPIKVNTRYLRVIMSDKLSLKPLIPDGI